MKVLAAMLCFASILAQDDTKPQNKKTTLAWKLKEGDQFKLAGAIDAKADSNPAGFIKGTLKFSFEADVEVTGYDEDTKKYAAKVKVRKAAMKGDFGVMQVDETYDDSKDDAGADEEILPGPAGVFKRLKKEFKKKQDLKISREGKFDLSTTGFFKTAFNLVLDHVQLPKDAVQPGDKWETKYKPRLGIPGLDLPEMAVENVFEKFDGKNALIVSKGKDAGGTASIERKLTFAPDEGRAVKTEVKAKGEQTRTGPDDQEIKVTVEINETLDVKK